MGSFWDRVGIVLRWCWDLLGNVLGSFWDRFLYSFCICWDRSGIVLGWCWDPFLIVLGSFWGRFGTF